eukprot:TRINITY_DN9142_c0_g1_i1.p1 TRINITY_DN9142_c0_g1~~TRINITY_DN9142_c0_g1_i1.p1  ORF type:complete len:361 (+),score=83.79 TRINITY_DN9142_c0_g1_i1:56-1138(+)
MNTALLTVLLAMAALSEGTPRCWRGWPDDDSGSSEVDANDEVCRGGQLYAMYSDAPRVCTVLAFVEKTAPAYFSYLWEYLRVGQPLSCSGQPDCHGTAVGCSDVSNLFAEKVVFYVDPAKFPVGVYQLRMYDQKSNFIAHADIKVVDCNTDAPETDAPSLPPVEGPPCLGVNPPLTYTTVPTVEMMEGWSDCTYNQKHIPAEWLSGHTCKGPRKVPEGTTFTLECPAAGAPCDWFVTHYHCPPCSSNRNGGWPAILTVEGWETGSCGPRIVNPYHHQTVTYRRQLTAGESVTIGPSTKETEYMTFHVMEGVVCEDLSAVNCDTAKYCSVKDGQCISNWCPRRHVPKPDRIPCLNCLDSCN